MDCKYSKSLLDNNSSCGVGKQQQQGFLDQQQQHFNKSLIAINKQQQLMAGYNGCNAPPTLPIDDFHLLENANKYGEEEKQLRIKLAAVYRLIEINGWSMGIYNHVTVSISLLIPQTGKALSLSD